MADGTDVRIPISGGEPSSGESAEKSSPNVSDEGTHPTMIQQTQSESGSHVSEVQQLAGAFDVGSLLGPYQIVRKLGQGGMGAVYEARHTKLKKTVAVKVLPPEMVKTSALVARFEREMEAVGALDHPHIVRATDAGEFNGTHFLVMEYVEGIDLSQLVKRDGPLPVDVALEVIRQAALGLQHAHEHGLVHRDIKPSNLLLARSQRSPVAPRQESRMSSDFVRATDSQANTNVDRAPGSPVAERQGYLDGEFTIKILDLGLARLGGDDSSSELTSSGQVLGTPDYMAPEQWDDTHSADARADLYSLGCTLYFVLTGRAPFAEAGVKPSVVRLMRAHVEGPIPELLAVRSDVPAELNAIYRRLLAKKPDERFQTAAEVAAALEQFTNNHDARASGPSSSSVAERSPVGPRQESRTSADVYRASDSSATTDITRKSGIPVAERQGYVDAPTTSILTPRSSSRGTSTTWQRVILAVGLLAFVVFGAIVIKITRKDGTTLEVVVPDDTKKVEITESSIENQKSKIPKAGTVGQRMLRSLRLRRLMRTKPGSIKRRGPSTLTSRSSTRTPSA